MLDEYMNIFYDEMLDEYMYFFMMRCLMNT